MFFSHGLGQVSLFLCEINNLYYECNNIDRLYDLMAGKLGREMAENLTNYIENKIKQDLESKTQYLATKEDVAKLDTKLSETKSELIKWMFAFWVSLLLALFFRD